MNQIIANGPGIIKVVGDDEVLEVGYVSISREEGRLIITLTPESETEVKGFGNIESKKCKACGMPDGIHRADCVLMSGI